MQVLRTVTKIWTLQSMRKTFISVRERRLETYITDSFGCLNDDLLGQILENRCTDRLRILAEKLEASGKVEYGWATIGTIGHRMFVDVYCFTVFWHKCSRQSGYEYFHQLIVTTLTTKYATCNPMSSPYRTGLRGELICIEFGIKPHLKIFLKMVGASCNK